MVSSGAQTQELKDLRAYAELAIYYTVTRGGSDVSPGELRGILQALRDILGDFAPDAAADREVGIAFVEARERAAHLGEDVGGWPESCPWGLDALLDQITSVIAELEANLLPIPSAKREQRRGRTRPARETGGPRRERGRGGSGAR